MARKKSGVFSNVNTVGTPQAGGGDASKQATVSAYNALRGIYKKEAEKILLEAGTIILHQAQMNVGWDDGALQESGRVEIEQTSKGPRVAIRFGGDGKPVAPTKNTRGGLSGDGVVDYAFFVHEDIHPKGPGLQPGKKYLERAVIETQTQVEKLITRRLKTATKLKRSRR